MKYVLIIICLLFVHPNIIYAGRGCCSRHGGQDYCDEETGRWVCKDGSYSPSCRCYSDTLTNSSNTNNNSNNINIPITDDLPKENSNLSLLEIIIAILFFTPIIFSSLMFLYIVIIAILPEKYLKRIEDTIIKIKNKFKN